MTDDVLAHSATERRGRRAADPAERAPCRARRADRRSIVVLVLLAVGAGRTSSAGWPTPASSRRTSPSSAAQYVKTTSPDAGDAAARRCAAGHAAGLPAVADRGALEPAT